MLNQSKDKNKNNQIKLEGYKDDEPPNSRTRNEAVVSPTRTEKRNRTVASMFMMKDVHK